MYMKVSRKIKTMKSSEIIRRRKKQYFEALLVSLQDIFSC